jgi:hypothetical protein
LYFGLSRSGQWLSWLTFFVVFLGSSKEIARTVPPLGYDRFAANTFRFIPRALSYYSKLYSLATESIVKQSTNK